MFFVYILHSKKLNRYYIGQTNSLVKRIKEHNDFKVNPTSFSKKGIPWSLFFKIECVSRTQARGIKTHIKKMKSKRYIENLPLYPAISEKLLLKYKE